MKKILFYFALPPSFVSCVQPLPQIVRKERDTSYHIVAAGINHKHTGIMHDAEHYEVDADIGKIKAKNYVVYIRRAVPRLGVGSFSRRLRNNDKDCTPMKDELVMKDAIINAGLSVQALSLMSTDRFVRPTSRVHYIHYTQ